MTDPDQAIGGNDEGLVRAIGTGALGANIVNMVVGGHDRCSFHGCSATGRTLPTHPVPEDRPAYVKA